MNRQKREEALRNSSQPGKPTDQPDRSKQPDREQVRGGQQGGAQEQKPPREPGKLPLPE